ncbi:MAG: magnesium chelatase ATPase subunit I, partial [Caldimicrobium sp.]
QPAQEELAKRIINAQKLLKDIIIKEEAFYWIVEITSEVNLDGHRADIVILKAARAYAAFNGDNEVKPEDIKKIAPLALKHRLKRLPFEDISKEAEKLSVVLSRI